MNPAHRGATAFRPQPQVGPGVDWAFLTRMDEKATLYERDVYFREGLRDAERIWGAEWAEVLHRSSLLMLKPDGLAAGVARPVHDFLERNGFAIVGAWPTSLAGHVWRALWRFQITAASTDRFLVNELLYQDPCLLLLLSDRETGREPATVRLARLKGSSDLALQAPNTLRALLRQPHRLFTYVHVADEPADLLREVAILFGRATRLGVLDSWLRPALPDAERALLEEAFSVPAEHRRSFDFEPALDRLEAAVADAGEALLLRDLRAMRAGARISWPDFAERLEAAGVAAERWDVATVGAYAIDVDDPGARKAIVTPDYDAWLGNG